MNHMEIKDKFSQQTHTAFITFLIGNFFVSLAGKFYELALPLYLYELHGTASILSMMRAVEFLPNLLFAFIIGVFIDRWVKHKIILISIFLQIIFMLIIYLAVVNQVKTPSIFYSLGFAFMLVLYIYQNARISSVKICLPKEFLTQANASFVFFDTLLMVGGPFIAGVIIWLGDISLSLVAAISLLISGFLIYSLNFQLENKENNKINDNHFYNELKAGFKIVISSKGLLYLSLATLVINALSGMYLSIQIFYCKSILNLEDFLVGIIISCNAAGSFLATLLVKPMRDRFGLGRTYVLSSVFCAIAYLIPVFFQQAHFYMISGFFASFFLTFQVIYVWTYRQESVSTDVIGRVTGITGSIFKIGMPLTIYISGILADQGRIIIMLLIVSILNFILACFMRLSLIWKLQ